MNRRHVIGLCAAAAASSLLATTTFAAFTADTLAVYRVGDGSTATFVKSAGLPLPINVDFFSAAAATNVPAATVNVSAFTGVYGSSATDDDEGHLNFSSNGQFLTFGGYAPNAGYNVSSATGLVATSSTDVPRAIVSLSGQSAADVKSTKLGGTAFTNTNINAAATTNGTDFFVGGGNTANQDGGLRYVNWSNPAAGTVSTVNVSHFQTGAANDQMRNVRLSGGEVYINTASQGTYGNRGVYRMTIGNDLMPGAHNVPIPPGGVATSSELHPVIVNTEYTGPSNTTPPAGYGDANHNTDPGDIYDTPKGAGTFYPKADAVFLDLNNDAQIDTAYSTGSKKEIEKWVKIPDAQGNNNGNNEDDWKRTNIVTFSAVTSPAANKTTGEVNSLAYTLGNGGVELFIATERNIFRLTDIAGIGQPIAVNLSDSFSTLNAIPNAGDGTPASAGSWAFAGSSYIVAPLNTEFRGIAFVPEPSCMALLSLAGIGLLRRRRTR